MNTELIAKVAGYIRHREPSFSVPQATAAALYAVEEIASWLAPQRNEIPACGWEFANSMLGRERYNPFEEDRRSDDQKTPSNQEDNQCKS